MTITSAVRTLLTVTSTGIIALGVLWFAHKTPVAVFETAAIFVPPTASITLTPAGTIAPSQALSVLTPKISISTSTPSLTSPVIIAASPTPIPTSSPTPTIIKLTPTTSRTPTPTITLPPPSETPTPVVTITPTANSSPLIIETFTSASKFARGSTYTITVRSLPNASCFIEVYLPLTGNQSKSAGIWDSTNNKPIMNTVDAEGATTWAWKVGSATKLGLATIKATCALEDQSATEQFQIEIIAAQ